MSAGFDRRRFLTSSAVVGSGAALGGLVPGSAAVAGSTQPDGIRVHVNNVGYAPAGPKRAVLAADDGDPITGFAVVDAHTGDVATSGTPEHAGPVADWGGRHYWTVDFSALTDEGEYVLLVEPEHVPGGRSAPFRIAACVLERYTLPHVARYFTATRSSGQFDKHDRSLPIGPDGPRSSDARGGWYDATGDYGKHCTQLSQHSFFNTLSVPLTAWVLFNAHEQLTARGDENFTQLRTWLRDEGLFGADYLTRIKQPGGTFYYSVVQPGPPKDPAQRYVRAAANGQPEQVSFREGGGVAIAALAAAGSLDVSGEHTAADYLRAGREAFDHLQRNNIAMTNDGEENIQDDYNALAAAVELCRATGEPGYRRAADDRASNLLDRLVSWRSYRDYWRADDGDRPYFHPSDAGLPVVALLRYLDVAAPAKRRAVLEVVRRSLACELRITAEVANPFGYARNLVQDETGRRYSSFFFPHTVTPRTDDQWWQGENARIASLATAARLAARHMSADFAARLRRYAADQLNWICGVNPYDVCMLDGSGRNNPQYEWQGSWEFLPAAGGIVNGITGRHPDGSGIAWDEGYAETGNDDDWRWTEQWLPHASWYLYAASIGE